MARNAYSFEKFQREKRKAEKRRQRLEKRRARQSGPAGPADAAPDDAAIGPAVDPDEGAGDAGATDERGHEPNDGQRRDPGTPTKDP